MTRRIGSQRFWTTISKKNAKKSTRNIRARVFEVIGREIEQDSVEALEEMISGRASQNWEEGHYEKYEKKWSKEKHDGGESTGGK